MGFWFERKCWNVSPSSDFNIINFRCSDGDGKVGDIGNPKRDVRELVFHRAKAIFLCLDGVPDRTHRGHGVLSGLLVAFELTHLFRTLFELMPEGFYLGNHFASGVE